MSNYLRGREPNSWITGVPNFSAVYYTGVYAGIDLTYHGSRAGELEFDLTVAPGADATRIRMAYAGVDRLGVDRSGGLVLHTGGGAIRQPAPVVYQRIDGARRAVHGRYVLRGHHRVGLSRGAYDRTAPLVIDPVVT